MRQNYKTSGTWVIDAEIDRSRAISGQSLAKPSDAIPDFASEAERDAWILGNLAVTPENGDANALAR